MYFKSATEAVEYAQIQTERQGYNVNPYEWFTKIACGGKYGRLRPSIGQYHSFIIELSKDGKPSKKCLSITLYGMDSGNFELVNYIN
jgi:hypothetical protein